MRSLQRSRGFSTGINNGIESFASYERYHNEARLFMEAFANPAFHLVHLGQLKYKARDFVGAIDDFSKALEIPGNIHNSSSRVHTLLMRAQCFFNLGILGESLRDSTEASNLSNEINLKEGFCSAVHLMMLTREKMGNIPGAFQLAVSLQTENVKEARVHVRRLRETLERIFREDATLVEELRNNLMSTGIHFFDEGRFKEAVTYFTEVVRLVCEFQFDPQAYLYKARCHISLDEYEGARQSCTAVLQRDPENEEGIMIMESVNAIIDEQNGNKKAPKRKSKKKKSSSPVPKEPKLPEKKPVMNKKQRKNEEQRRLRELEKIGVDIKEKIDKDWEKQQQRQQTEKNTEMEEAKPLPSYDVKAALDATNFRRKPSDNSDKQTNMQAIGGARPKQVKMNNKAKPKNDKNDAKKQHKDDSGNNSPSSTSKRASSSMPSTSIMAPSEHFFKRAFKVQNLSFAKNSFEADVSTSNQANVSIKPEDDWIFPPSDDTLQPSQKLLQSFDLSQDRKSHSCQKQKESHQVVTSSSRSPNRPCLKRNGKENQNEEEAFSNLGFADTTSNFQQSWSFGTKSSREERPLVSEIPETLTDRDGSRWIDVDAGKTPISQWTSLEQISSLKIHNTLNLTSPAESSKRTQLTPRGDKQEKTTEVSNFGHCSPLDTLDEMPKGVVRLCKHFLEDRKTPSQPTYVCINCSKHSMFEYGIWRSLKKEWQLMRPYPAGVDSETRFQICWHYADGRKCQQSCTFAHGEEELSLWTLNRQKDRVSSLNIRKPRCLTDDHDDFNINCKPQQSIRGSLKIYDERETQPRPAPSGVYHGDFQLCRWWKSGRKCRTGRFCTFAHGCDELRSWRACANKEAEEEKSTQSSRSVEDLTCKKAEKIAHVSRNEMVYSLPGVEVTCDEPTMVKLSHSGDEKNHNYKWVISVTFEVSEVGMLKQIDLLHKYHSYYRITKVEGFLNDNETFSRVPTERWSYSLPMDKTLTAGKMKVNVSVSFETEMSDRTFTQCLQFNFGKKPHLLHGLNVDIASQEALNTISMAREKLKLDPQVWTQPSVNVLAWSGTTAVSYQDKVLQERYTLPARIENVGLTQVMEVNITTENYQRVMHQLLFAEELFMKKAISSFVIHNVTLHGQQSCMMERAGLVCAEEGELFGVLTIQENGTIQPDDAAGRLLIRNVQTAWLKLAGSSSQDVYEALVEKIESTSGAVVLRLSRKICLDLHLTNNGKVSVDVQFQLNRQPLCEWHAAIDRLGPTHLSLLFPEPNASQATLKETPSWNCLPLDPEQRKVIRRILTPGSSSPPLVVFGPFGTGKTFTLHQAIRQLVAMRNNCILLCTHTNSAADLHVKLLHDYLTEEKGLQAAKPLRIYHTWRRLDADSMVAKRYALVKNNAYVLPTREDVIKHRVVITTLATSNHLLHLQLNHGFFTHILVDEAAQALEPEALTPLVLAGPNTKIVFTGDHMQMKPEVYSHFARECGLQRSLPERLFDHYYQSETQLGCNVEFLTRNYRCHRDILQFPSYNFYGGEEGKDGLIACSEEAAHPRLGPLLFFSVYGVEEALQNSYINEDEANEVVRRVKELSDDWPVEWGKKHLSKIGVISAYMTQVRVIRTLLRKEGPEFAKVTVESIYNVQGKEFRAVFISTVRTSFTCQSFHQRDRGSGSRQLPYWEFLSDSTLLNTAITRAKSLVSVIGNPVSLCTVGECRGNWRDYIRRCNDRKALYGISYEELKKEIRASLSRISLNPKAATFVPKSTTVSNQECKSVKECATQADNEGNKSLRIGLTEDGELDSSAYPIQGRHNRPITVNSPEPGTIKEDSMKEEFKEEDEDEREEEIKLAENEKGANQDGVSNTSQSTQEEDENGPDTFFDEFRFDDETVFSRYQDKIIKALLETCKKTKDTMGNLEEVSENESLQAAKISQTRRSKNDRHAKHRSGQQSCFFDLPSDDYEILNINGRKVARLVNLGFNQAQSTRRRRLTASFTQPNFLEPEVLHRNLLKDPKKYLPCTLRLSSESFRTAYAVVSDTKTPDIKIKGRIRGLFDMDRVVIERTDCKPLSSKDNLCSWGKIVGVLNHIISPRERRFVCRVDYENPALMLPINKSVSRILILTTKNECMPIHKEMRDGDETTVRVDEMDLEEFCSGKHLFLVQFFQWKPDCAHPVGNIIRKLPQKCNLEASMEILFAEHGIRRSFDEESQKHVRSQFPLSWSVPTKEYKNREKIDGAFTIDPDSSKDLDDALTMEPLPNNVYRVGVHIADVSYFVEEGTPLDKEALFRCTSYYPGHDYKSVPMLPPELSENNCSLLPGKDRLSLSVILELTDEGKLVGEPQIKRTIVSSCCKLSYSDAQRIIEGQQCVLPYKLDDTARKIQLLSSLAQKRRMSRLRDAAFDHWSNSDYDPKNFLAHEMVEEMMILANEQVAKFLFTKSPEIAPLRAQLPPKEHRLSEWARQYGQYFKYSLFLRGFYSEKTLKKMSKDAMCLKARQFKVQESVWSEIYNAAISEDQDKLQFLICNESHHPQLLVTKSQFQRIQSRSHYTVCEEDQPEENIGHFSLGMHFYTHFTSPIRRYIDIQVHRLVVSLISQDRTANKPSKDQVAKVCRRSTFSQDNSRKFDKGCSKVILAAKLKKRSHETKAVISLIDNQAISLEILNQEHNYLSTRQRTINFSNLNPFTIDFNQDGPSITFTWRPRLYKVPQSDILVEAKCEKEEVNELLSQENDKKEEVLNLPAENWQQILKALQEENYKKLRAVVAKTDAVAQRPSASDSKRTYQSAFDRQKANDKTNSRHFYDKRLCLRTFDVVNIQLTAHMTHGTLHPEVQLFKINPRVHICIEHRKYPRECFADTSKHQASRERYSSLDHYINLWKPVLAMEAATEAVNESDEFTIHHLKVQWTKKSSGDAECSFSIVKEYCTSRQIDFFPGDFVCVRVKEDEYMAETHSGSWHAGTEKSESKHKVTQSAMPSSERSYSMKGYSSRQKSGKDSATFWVGHCIIQHVHVQESVDQDNLVVTMDLHQSSSVFPEELMIEDGHPSILTVIHRSLTHRRMFEALCKGLKNSSHLVHAMCMGHDPGQEKVANLPSSRTLSIVHMHPTCGLKPLNRYQEAAVREALVKPLTLVQGPPGTGKTVTGVHMAYWFTKQNMQLQPQAKGSFDTDDQNGTKLPKAPPQVIYCGPSNKSVDVVAYKMLKIPDLKIIRVYGNRKEEAEFPIPNKLKPLKSSTDDEDQTHILDEELKAVSLHHVIRGEECPFASELRQYELQFAADRKNNVLTSDTEVEKYCKLIGEAKEWALKRTGVQIILCTCAVAGSSGIVNSCSNIQQCIVDECGMCLETESLVPITCSRARQVVLIGDHKQLQPIIQDHVAKKLGLNISMFERLSKRAMMLKLQYRMHEDICRFPSDYFYEGNLKTDPTVPTCDPLVKSFWPTHEKQPENTLPIAFCHVEGEEESSAIKTSQSNEQSKANMKEVRKVAHVARCLVQKKRVRPENVVILSPYREQRKRISDSLKDVQACKDILVTTITKSQGSEWDYVIISLVRSLKKDEIDPDPSLKWLREHLGFLTDEHQINVGLTRARRGLCIIGNKNLLGQHTMWQSLLGFYEENHCLVNDTDWPSN